MKNPPQRHRKFVEKSGKNLCIYLDRGRSNLLQKSLANKLSKKEELDLYRNQDLEGHEGKRDHSPIVSGMKIA